MTSPQIPSPSAGKTTPKSPVRGFSLALPGIFWMLVFFLLPLIFVLVASFMSRGRGGVPEWPLTTANFERTFGVFLPVVLRSLRIAFLSTLFCLLLGYPLAFFISTRTKTRNRQLALFFILLPFWTNLLVRTYAIQTILGREGLINTMLLSVGIIQEPLTMLNTSGAVLLGLVYTYLPFMVLPVYAAVERLDTRYVEAAFDLGANDWQAFWRVIVPLTMPGVVAGCTLVFIPAIGSFVTPDLLGGTRGLMIGNLIQRQFSGNGNIPLGSAVSVVLMVVVLLGAFINVRFGEERSS
ncbi:MAG: ABC transporter permease [Deinococcota bacterium]